MYFGQCSFIMCGPCSVFSQPVACLEILLILFFAKQKFKILFYI